MIFEDNNQYTLIRNQFPEFYVEQNSDLPTLLEKYYQYLESSILQITDLSGNFEVGEIVTANVTKSQLQIVGISSVNELFVIPKSVNLLKNNEIITGNESGVTATVVAVKVNPIRLLRDVNFNLDISTVSDEFVGYYTNEFFNFLPSDIKTDLRKLILNSIDVYTSRGTEDSLKWLWRSLYNSNNLEIIYPKDVILKVSDGKWIQENSLRISEATSTNYQYFTSRTIYGKTSGAQAIVDSIQRYSYGAKVIIELFVSSILGTFIPNEEIYTDEIDGIVSSGFVESALVGVSIIDGGSNYSIGDEVNITGVGGAKAFVSKTNNGRILDLDIIFRGDGFFVGNILEVDNTDTSGSGFGGKVSSLGGDRFLFLNTDYINTFSTVPLNQLNYGDDFDGIDVNSILISNSLNTFTATVVDSTNFAKGQKLTTTSNSVVSTIISVLSPTEILYAIKNASSQNFIPGHDGLYEVIAYDSENNLVSGASTNVTSVSTITEGQVYGAFNGSYQQYGPIRSISIDSPGVGYKISPIINIENPIISSLQEYDEILGERNKKLTFNSNVAGIFEFGKRVLGQTSGATGFVTDEFVASSNSSESSIFYYSTNTKVAIDSTDILGTDENDSLLLEDGSTLIFEYIDFEDSETVIQIETVRTKNISAQLVSSNSVVLNLTQLGNNAYVEANSFGVGSIQEVTIEDFGIGYLSTPDVSAPTGDNNAILTAQIGTISQYPGRYQNLDGLLDETNKIQDSFYYQNFSYVLKTDIPVNIFRSDVKSFIHPSGWALFGEIAIRSLFSVGLFQTTSGVVPANQTQLKKNILLDTANAQTLNDSEKIIHIVSTEPSNTLNVEIKERDSSQQLYKLQFPDFYPEDEVTIDVSFTTNSAVSSYQSSITVNDINSIIKNQYIESRIEKTLSLTSNIKNIENVVTGTYLNLSTRRVLGQIFQYPGSNIFTSSPTIEQFFLIYDTNEQNELAGWYDSVLIDEVVDEQISPIEPATEVQFDNILFSLENASADKLLMEDGSGNLTLEGDQGLFLVEENHIEFETATPGVNDRQMFIHQIEDYKYYVVSANSTHFTVNHPDDKYIPEGLISTTVQHYNYY